MPLPKPCSTCGKVYNRLTRFSKLCPECLEIAKQVGYSRSKATWQKKRLQSKEEALIQIRQDLKEFEAIVPGNKKLGGSRV